MPLEKIFSIILISLAHTATEYCRVLADDAVRVAMGWAVSFFATLKQSEWVKLEVLGSKDTVARPCGTIEATRRLVDDGFTVLVYSSDDPIVAKRLKDLGAASVMPAGSPIGSGRS